MAIGVWIIGVWEGMRGVVVGFCLPGSHLWPRRRDGDRVSIRMYGYGYKCMDSIDMGMSGVIAHPYHIFGFVGDLGSARSWVIGGKFNLK